MVWGLVGETGNSPTFIRNLPLVFSFFSPFASILTGAGSRGLKAGRGVAVVSCGVRETRRSSENSRVFRRLSFFFIVFFFFFFLSFSFPGRYNNSLNLSLVDIVIFRLSLVDFSSRF